MLDVHDIFVGAVCFDSWKDLISPGPADTFPDMMRVLRFYIEGGTISRSLHIFLPIVMFTVWHSGAQPTKCGRSTTWMQLFHDADAGTVEIRNRTGTHTLDAASLVWTVSDVETGSSGSGNAVKHVILTDNHAPVKFAVFAQDAAPLIASLSKSLSRPEK